MMQTTLCLAFHNHQPVGNFPWVFQEAYDHAYLPMIQCLERHPMARVSLHYTGPLIEWVAGAHPEFLDRVAGLVQRGQVEMMTGGYYEPILPSIPELDRQGQIRKMTDYVEARLGARPTGLWLAERVWEPQLAATLAKAGVDWTIVDDTHFKSVGLTDADLTGYYLTEDEGFPVKVFATSKQLRYVIPWATVEKVIATLDELASDDPDAVVVMGDDGEKFGVWPGTFDHCWTKGWVDRFFEELERNADWIKLRPVGEYARAHPAKGRIYLPTASYAEMLEWALPWAAAEEFHKVFHEHETNQREDVVRYLRGGFWRNFLVKYDEVNTMHKKMLRAHRKVRSTGSPPDPVATDELWQAQCNCPYWHGVFGGIYMTDIRTATFSHLIRSERRSDEVSHGTDPWIAHELTDFDYDSRDELIVESRSASYYLSPARGGALFEWDARAQAHNLISVLTRRAEAYHDTVRAAAGAATRTEGGGAKTIHDIVRLKESGLEKQLHVDWYRRAALIDHFLGPAATAAGFAGGAEAELGDFVDQQYHCAVAADSLNRRVELRREGHVSTEMGVHSVLVGKTIELAADNPGFQVRYHIVNHSNRPLVVTFGVELCLNLLGGGGNPAAFRRFVGEATSEDRFDVPADQSGVAQVVAGNSYLGVEVTLLVEPPARAWWSSIDTISSSEGGFERIHQGSALLYSWPLELQPGSSRELRIKAAIVG
jgi:4-alpha-glucanotransferase